MSSSKPASRRSESTSQGEASSDRPARRSQHERSRDASRTSDKYPLFEVDWWRVGEYVVGAVVLGGLYLYGIGASLALVENPAVFDDLGAICIGLGGIGSLLGILWCLVRWPRVVLYETVIVIGGLLTATRFLPAYTSIEAWSLIYGSMLYLPLVVGGGIGVVYRRSRGRRPSDRSRRDRRRRH